MAILQKTHRHVSKIESVNNSVKLTLMGRNYGIINSSKYHKVSGNWPGCLPTANEVREIARILGWDLKTDSICSFSYCDGYEWNDSQSDWIWLEPVADADTEEYDENDEKEEWEYFGVKDDEGMTCTLGAFNSLYFCN